MTIAKTVFPGNPEPRVIACETCKWWVGDTKTNKLGVCSLLTRPAGTVSTFLEGEKGDKAIFRCSRHFGCNLHQEDKP